MYAYRQQLFHDSQTFLRDLHQSIQGQREAIAFYQQLSALAPNDFARRQITHALSDEMRHDRMLTQLYQRLTGQQPQVSIRPPHIPSFGQGVERAFEDEIDAAETYKRMYLNAQPIWIRDIFFDIMHDEIEHASRFAYIRGTL